MRTTAQFKVQGGASHHLGEERQAVSVRGAREGVTPRAMLVLGLRLEITHSEELGFAIGRFLTLDEKTSVAEKLKRVIADLRNPALSL